VSKPVLPIPELLVKEDDQIGLIANRLGVADISNISQLTDTTTGLFISRHKTAVVTFYQKCEPFNLIGSFYNFFCSRVCSV